MRLRRATASDAAAIRSIVDRAYGHYVERIGMRPGPMDDDYDARVASASSEVTVVEVDGAVAGYVVLVPSGDHLLVENVGVDPSHQGLGLGTALLDFAERRARDLGLDEIRLYTHELMTENRALYARRGFAEDELRVEHGLARVFLSKRLSG